MNATDNLLPCPFCGGVAEIIENRIYLDTAIRVRCTNCKVVTKPVLINKPRATADGVDETTRYSRQQATVKSINLWNRRANDDSV